MANWVWQPNSWPSFTWHSSVIDEILLRLERKQGLLLGKANVYQSDEQSLHTILSNIVSSSAIESESVNVFSLRSSLAKHMGLQNYDESAISLRSEGLAKLSLDTLQNAQQDLTLERLFTWHKLLFAEQANTLYSTIRIGRLRGDEPMQVVSGRIDNPKVHFEAPPRDKLEAELQHFLAWFNDESKALNPFLRAGLCHFWFITLHPFDDGNGRITRALTDMVLAQGDKQAVRLYAVATAILKQRKTYYEVLESSQKWPSLIDDKIDVTTWLVWFLSCVEQSMDDALSQIDKVVSKAKFWRKYQELELSKEQRKVLNRLLDGGDKGFELGINASQYQKVAKVSKATATRHLSYLLEVGCLERLPGGGRSTRYQIKSVD